jgi:ABC-type Mn2+/Zn2+ transport system ATPase subunit
MTGGPAGGGQEGAVTGGSLVRVEDLSGGYGNGREAIAGVSFVLGAGEAAAVLGPNGGGKTTLFRALLRELPVRRGTVELAGLPAYVPQTERARLDFPVSAFDVALMGAFSRTPFLRRVSRADRHAADAALERVGLADRARDLFGTLSGGQRQRVLIARALVQDAPVLLLDEPLSGVDAPSAARIEAVLGELRAEGRALLLATHDVGQARRLDRVLCLHRRQVAFGAPAETLSAEVLQATYGAEMVVLADGRIAVTVDHHDHAH